MSDINQPPPPPPPPPGAAPPPMPGAGGSEEKNSLGIWALVLGILSIVCSCGPFTGIPAIIVGRKAKEAQAQGRANNGTLGQVGFVLGIIGTALFVVVVVLYAILFSVGVWDASMGL